MFKGQPPPKIQCPARESKCIKGTKVGHWAKARKSLPDKRVAELNSTGRQDEGELFLGELTELSAVQGGTGDSWKALVSMNGQLIEFKEDSGADVTVIPPSLFHSLKPTSSLSKTTSCNQGTHGSMSTETIISIKTIRLEFAQRKVFKLPRDKRKSIFLTTR